MRRVLVFLSLLGLAAAPAAARAAEPLTAAPFAAVGAHRVATCLRATGAPGELALAGPWGAHGATDLWSATTAGPVRAGRLPVAFQAECAEVASDPGGSAVAAVPARTRVGGRVQRLLAAVRAPGGGGFAAPRAIARVRGTMDGVAVAVNARGDAVVAWREVNGPVDPDALRTRVRAVLWRAGESPGAPVALRDWHPLLHDFDLRPAVGIDAAGTATVAFRRGTVRVATAPPGGGFATPVALPGTGGGLGGVGLAVAPDGGTLVASGSGPGTVLHERPVDAGTFRSVPLRGGAGVFAGRFAVAVADGGVALLAWRESDDIESPVYAVTRPGAGAAFGPPRRLTGGARDGFGIEVAYGSSRGVDDHDNTAPRVLLEPNGRTAVAWVAGGSAGASRAWLATGTAARGLGRARRFGSPVRDADNAAPVALPGGSIALAWTDDARGDVFAGLAAPPGRLHVALTGATPAADPAPPRVRLRVPPRVRLYPTQGFHAAVRCSAACDLLLRGAGGAVERTLRGGRWTRLPVGAGLGVPSRRVPVTAIAAAPGGNRTARSRAVTRVVRRPPPPVPRILDARARRSGRRIVVTWRTDRPARRVVFQVVARATRRERSIVGGTTEPGRGRTRHRVVIGPHDRLRGGKARWIALSAFALDRPKPLRPILLRIR